MVCVYRKKAKDYYLHCLSSCVLDYIPCYGLHRDTVFISLYSSSVSGSSAPTPVSGSGAGAGSAFTQGMEQLASFPSHSCLFFIACSMQKQRRKAWEI